MKPILFLFILLPFIANAQCPEIIGASYSNAIALKSEFENVAGVQLADSTIKGERESITYAKGNVRFRIANINNNEVKSIAFTGLTSDVKKLFENFTEKYAACRVNHGYQWAQYKTCKIYWKPLSQTMAELYISKD